MSSGVSGKPRWAKAAGLAAAGFGLATVLTGAGALFGGDTSRALAGNVVPLVLWFNFIAGFAYIVAGLGIVYWRSWACPLATAIAVASLLVLVLFIWRVAAGDPYEMRTAWAMPFRAAFWVAYAVLLNYAGRPARA